MLVASGRRGRRGVAQLSIESDLGGSAARWGNHPLQQNRHRIDDWQ